MNRKTHLILFIFFGLLFQQCHNTFVKKNNQPFDLKTESATNPIGIDTPQPVFSWKTGQTSSETGDVPGCKKQKAYRILVASEPKRLFEGKADIWDSGRINSSKSYLVKGMPLQLQSKTIYYWTVRIWDEKDKESKYAAPAWFETGMLFAEDWDQWKDTHWISLDIENGNDRFVDFWKNSLLLNPEKRIYQNIDFNAKELISNNHKMPGWLNTIQPSLYLRHEFELKADPVRARLYVSGQRDYQSFINGKKVNDSYLELNPYQSTKQSFYNVFDVAKYLIKGNNCIGAIVCSGRWDQSIDTESGQRRKNKPMLFARMEIDLIDGSKRIITTDSNWKAGTGPLRVSAFETGEAYDANKIQKNWNIAGFDESKHAWKPVRIEKKPKENLTRDKIYSLNRINTIQAIDRIRVSPGVWVYDFGQMVFGKVKVKFHLPEGKMIRVRYSETVNKTFTSSSYQSMFYQSYSSSVDKTHPDFLCVKNRSGSKSGKHAQNTSEEELYAMGFADAYKSDGTVHVWTNSFNYFNFRYIEISELDNPPETEDVVAVIIYSESSGI